MNAITVTTSAGDQPAEDYALEYVKAKLLDEAPDEGKRQATIDNKAHQWSKHLKILAEFGITRISEANRTHVKNALKTYRERPNPVTGKQKKGRQHSLTLYRLAASGNRRISTGILPRTHWQTLYFREPTMRPCVFSTVFVAHTCAS